MSVFENVPRLTSNRDKDLDIDQICDTQAMFARKVSNKTRLWFDGPSICDSTESNLAGCTLFKSDRTWAHFLPIYELKHKEGDCKSDQELRTGRCLNKCPDGKSRNCLSDRCIDICKPGELNFPNLGCMTKAKLWSHMYKDTPQNRKLQRVGRYYDRYTQSNDSALSTPKPIR